MGAVAAQTLHISGAANRAWFHAAVSDLLLECIESYLPIDELVAAIPAAEERGTWGVRGDVLAFTLGVPSDHLIELAIAVDWDQLVVLAGNEGVVIETARPPVRVTDCTCTMCSMIRPAPACLASILAEVETARGRRRFARIQATPEVLVDVIRTGDAGLRWAVERLAARVGHASWDAVVPLLPALVGDARSLAVCALAAVDHDAAEQALLVDVLRDELAASANRATIAAERAPAALLDDIVAILDRVDAPDSLRHAAVLAVFRFHRIAPSFTIDVRRRLEREATADTDAGKLATLLLANPA